MTKKTPTDEDKEKCKKEAISTVCCLMPGDWGQLVSSQGGRDSALAVASFPHNKHNDGGFLILSDANYCEYSNRYDEDDEEYLNGFQLEHKQIEWLHRELGFHLANRKLMDEELNYKIGDKICLKAGAHLPRLGGVIGKADYLRTDHNSDTVKVSWKEMPLGSDVKDMWRFAPARLFEKA